MKSLSAKTFQCGVTVQGLTTLSGTVYLTALTNTATWDYIIVGTSAQGQLYTRTYAQLMSDVSSGITLSLDGLSDVVAPTPSTGQLLRYNGIQWANWTPNFLSAEADTLATVTGRDATTNTSITVGPDLIVQADGSVNYTASRLWLNSHNNYRGAGVHMSGVGSTWFAGTPYTDFDGGYVIAKTGTSNDVSSAQYSNALLTVKSNGNIGIGTTSPSYKLDVNGETRLGKLITTWSNSPITPSAVIYSESGYNTVFAGNGQFSSSYLALMTNGNMSYMGGNVGIGTGSPNQKLSVEGGSIQLNANNVAANYYLYLNKKSGQDGGILFNRDNANDWQLTNGAGNGDLVFYSYGTSTEAITFKRNTGNVGIGTTTPYEKLEVNGAISATGAVNGTSAQGHSTTLAVQSGTSFLYAVDWGAEFKPISVQAKTISLETGTGSTTSRFFIDNSGNVGIGTISPDTKLHVWNGDSGGAPYEATGITIESSGRAALNFLSGSGNDAYVFFGNSSAGNAGYVGYENTANRLVLRSTDYISLIDSTGEAIRIDNGNVGIGTTSPSYRLDVGGDINFTSTLKFGGTTVLSNSASDVYGNIRVLYSASSINDGMYINYNSSGGTGADLRLFANGTNERVRIKADSGNVGIGTTSPNEKLHVSGNSVGITIDGTIASRTYYNRAGAYIWSTGLRAGDTKFHIYDERSADRFVIDDSGNVGIGTISPGYKLDVNGTFRTNDRAYIGEDVTFTSPEYYYLLSASPDGLLTFTNNTVTQGQAQGFLSGELYLAGSAAFLNHRGINIITTNRNTSTGNIVRAFYASGRTGNTGAANTIAGFLGGVNIEGSGNVTNAIGLEVELLSQTNNKTITNMYGVKVQPLINSVGTITNTYGLYIDSLTAGTQTNPAYGIYQAGTDKNYFGGNVGIGTTNPGFKLDVNGAARVNQGGVNGSGQALIVAGSGDIQLTDGGSLFFGAYDYGGSTYIRAYDDSNIMYFYLNGTNMAYFRNDRAYFNANVGIGTSSPTQILHVAGNIRVTGAFYDSNNQAGSAGQILKSTGTGTDWVSLSEITGVDGSGTANYVTKWSDADTVTNSLIYDNGTNVGIGTTSPGYNFDVNGQVRVQDKLRVGTVNSGNGVVHMSSSATINPNTTTIVWAQNVSVGMCAFIEYYILNNNSLTDQRAGTIMVTWNQSGTPTIAHTETTTPDIGSTTSINFTSSLVGSDARINAVNSSANPYTIVMSYKYF